MPHAVLYARFSPRPNADECDSNHHQLERCKKYCLSKDYYIKGMYWDDSISGKTLIRPGLTNALDALQTGWVLIVDRQDRLARDLLVSLTIHHEVEKRGCTIEFADGSPIRTTPEGKLFQSMLAAFAAFECDKIAERTKIGMARKKAEGVWIGRPPIGYRVAEGKLCTNESEQHAIKLLLQCYYEKFTPSETASWLNMHNGLLRDKPWTARKVLSVLAKQKKLDKA